MNSLPHHSRDDDRVTAVIAVLDELLRRLEQLGDSARDARTTLSSLDTSPEGAGAPWTALRAALRREEKTAPRAASDEPTTVTDDHPPASPGRSRLTHRQQQVLDLLSQGTSNRRISRRLNITEQTVKAHLHMIYHKLGAADRTEAVVIALNDGLVSWPGNAAAPPSTPATPESPSDRRLHPRRTENRATRVEAQPAESHGADPRTAGHRVTPHSARNRRVGPASMVPSSTAL